MTINRKLKNTPYRKIKVSGDRVSVRFDKDVLKEMTSKQDTSVRLEVIKNNRLGYASSTHEDEESLINKALTSSTFGDKVNYDYPDKLTNIPDRQIYSKRVEDLETSYFIRIGKYIIESIKQHNSDILVSIRLSKAVTKGVLEISNGSEITEQSTALGIYADGELVSEGDILAIDNSYFWRDQTFNEVEFVQHIVERFTWAKKITKIGTGKYPVIFAPEPLSLLFEFVETALSADTLFRKVSKWQDKQGLQVVSDKITLIDDPSVNFAPGTTSTDDEGFLINPLPLITRGTLSNYYTDLKYASRLKIKPNGRGFGLPAGPSLTNLMIEKGEKTSQELIKGIKKGLIVDAVVGGGQDSPYAGDFSLNIHLGYLVENGEVVGRVKNCLISGNAFDMLKNNLSEISSDTKWVGGSNLPHMLFNDVTIAGNN